MTSPLLVRRRSGGGFNPTRVAGLTAWLRAGGTLYQDSARTTLVAADGDPVGSWSDESGNGNHFSQATSTARPLYKTAIVNALPVVRFDGVDDLLSRASIFAGTADFSLFVVGRYTAGTGGAFFTERSGTATTPVHAQIDLSGGNYRNVHRNDANSLQQAQGAAPASGTWMIIQASQATLAMKLRRGGGAADTSNATSGATTVTVAGVGGAPLATPATFLTGDIAEVIVYNQVLTLANVDLVGNYLAAKYGLTWTAAS